jgi:FMN phosphatase YigB (HAD superfamily)
MKILLFDLVGTVFNMSSAREGDLSYYGHQISDWRDPVKARQAIWVPLNLPQSWEILPPHLESKAAINVLRSSGKFRCVTLSNLPIRLQIEMSANAGINWDFMVPLETSRVYKTHPAAYLSATRLFGTRPADDFVMVTANQTYGDLEAAERLGMHTVLIDRTNRYANKENQRVNPPPTFKVFPDLFTFAHSLDNRRFEGWRFDV